MTRNSAEIVFKSFVAKEKVQNKVYYLLHVSFNSCRINVTTAEETFHMLPSIGTQCTQSVPGKHF